MTAITYYFSADGEGKFRKSTREHLDAMFEADPVACYDFLSDMEIDLAELRKEYVEKYNQHWIDIQKRRGNAF